MVDFDKLIVSRLRELSLPVYYDYCLDETNEAPCISYYQYDNNAYANGDTLGYSKIIYKIKVWNIVGRYVIMFLFVGWRI